MSIGNSEKFKDGESNLKIQSGQDLFNLRHVEGSVSVVGNDEIDIGKKAAFEISEEFLKVLYRIVFDVHHTQVFPVEQFTGFRM